MASRCCAHSCLNVVNLWYVGSTKAYMDMRHGYGIRIWHRCGEQQFLQKYIGIWWHDTIVYIECKFSKWIIRDYRVVTLDERECVISLNTQVLLFKMREKSIVIPIIGSRCAS